MIRSELGLLQERVDSMLRSKDRPVLLVLPHGSGQGPVNISKKGGDNVQAG